MTRQSGGSLPGCARCRSREVPLPRCPYCGAAASELRGVATDAPPPPMVLADAALENRLRIWAVPVVFVVAFAALQSDALHSLARIFLTMWLHELGHAIAGWMTGYPALPGPWRTWIGDERMVLVTVVVVVAFAGLAYRAWSADRRRWAAALAAAAALALIGSALVSPRTARMLFTFCGDAGMMLIGAGLALTFWAPVGSHLHTSWLRWGFLVIGAFAILDGSLNWWAARSDSSAIPYGEIEGVGLSDPSKLVGVHGWSERQMVARYTLVSLVAVVAVLGRWIAGVWQVRRERERER